MATLIRVTARQCKTCDRCGVQITFAKNRHGKSFPVNVYYHEGLRSLVYETGIGAHGNLTPWHSCQKVEEQRQRGEERRAAEELNARMNEIARPYADAIDAALLAGNVEEVKRLSDELRDAYKAAGLS